MKNAGVWCVGRLATDADRERVVDAMAGNGGAAAADPAALSNALKMLAPRWFLLRNVHSNPELTLLQSRTTLCWLRGPMTRGDLRRLRELRQPGQGRAAEAAGTSPVAPVQAAAPVFAPASSGS